jgi:dTDP-6-deoxy-L-talose 4-dehydrogenase (NAD+)
MNILVTGANGYLGVGIVKALLDQGHVVVAADLEINNVDDRAQKVKCDIFALQDPYQFFKQPNTMLHLAWRNGFIHNADTHIEDFPMHYKFIKNMIENGLDKVCVMGSMHEIGFYEGSINENTCCSPSNLYGISKNALRETIEILTNLNKCLFQWLRGFYIVGESELGSSIFSKIIKAEKSGLGEFPFTSGENQYDFLDYSIFCKYVATVITQDAILGIINVCSGKPEKLSERVERFITENNLNIKLTYGAFPDRPYDSKALWGDSTKISKILSNTMFD